jgi:hypothetical protein
MTVETVWSNAAGQVIAMTESGARSRVSAGIDPMKVNDIIPIRQPSGGMIRTADHTVRAIVAGKTADPGYAPIKVQTVTLRTKIDRERRVRRSRRDILHFRAMKHVGSQKRNIRPVLNMPAIS